MWKLQLQFRQDGPALGRSGDLSALQWKRQKIDVDVFSRRIPRRNDPPADRFQTQNVHQLLVVQEVPPKLGRRHGTTTPAAPAAWSGQRATLPSDIDFPYRGNLDPVPLSTP